MKISYRKDLSHSYMILTGIDDFREDDFAARLLKKGHVPYLLDLETEKIDSSACLLYDISGKQSFEKTYETEKMTYKNLCDFLNSLKSLTSSMADYLLDCDSILMEAGTIFTNHDRNEYYFCYYPPSGFSSQLQLRALFNTILSIIDYDEPKAVTLAFSLNRISQSDSFTISDLLQAMNKPEEMVSIYDEMEPSEFIVSTASSAEGCNSSEVIGDTDNPSFFGKAKTYFGSSSFTDIIDDINSGKIIRKIKSQSSEDSTVQALPASINEETSYPAISTATLPTNGFPANAISTATLPTNGFPANALPTNVFPAATFQDTVEEDDSITQSLALSDYLTHKLIGTGHAENSVIVIDNFPFSIGKSPACNYRLCFPTVSRMHCRIYIDSDNPSHLYIEDLNSTNGTFHNDVRLNPYEKQLLSEGDIIRICEISFVFR